MFTRYRLSGFLFRCYYYFVSMEAEWHLEAKLHLPHVRATRRPKAISQITNEVVLLTPQFGEHLFRWPAVIGPSSNVARMAAFCRRMYSS